MMLIELTTDIALRRDALRRVLKAAYTTIGEQWHSRYSQVHFTAEGARRYHYTRRSTKDVVSGASKKTKRGKNRAPSGLPLVWSGRSRELARQKVVRATYKGCRVVSPVRVFNFIPPRNKQLRMREEYTTVTASEVRTLEGDAKKTMDQQITAEQQKQTSRKRIK